MIFGFGRKNTANAQIVVGAKTGQAQKALKKLDSQAKSLGKSFKSAKASMGFAAAGLAALTIAAVAAKKALDFTVESIVKFEAAGKRLKAIVKPTGEEFKKLEKYAMELGETTVFTATQVLESFTEMGKLGLETNEILAAGNDVLALAALAQVDMATAATITAQALNQFQLDASEAGRVVDVIAESFTSSALDITKFSEAMKFIGPIAGQTGEQIEGVTAALAVLADNALDSSMAGTAMRRMLLELANENSKASKLIAATGRETNNLTDKLKILKDMQISVTDATELFGLRAATGATIVINAANSVEELTKQFENADGAAKEMAETMLDSVKGSAIRLEAAQESLALSIREKMLPVLRAWNEWLISINRGMKALIDPSGFAAALSRSETALTDLALEREKIQRRIVILTGMRWSGLKLMQPIARKLLEIEKEKLKAIKEQESVLSKPEEIAKKDPEALTRAFKEQEERRKAESTGDIKAQVALIAEKKKLALKAAKDKKKAAEKAAKEEEEFWIDNGRKQLQIEELYKAEQLRAKQDAAAEMASLQASIDAQGDERERQRWDNTLRIEFEGNVAVLGYRQAAYEEELKDLKKQLDRKLILQEDYDKELKRLEAQNNEEIKQEKLDRANENLTNLGTINNALMSMVDARTERELKALDKLNLSDEEHEKRREEILKEGEEKRKKFARVQQSIAIAEATIAAIQIGLGSAKDTPGGAITRILAMGAGIAAGLAEVATIQSQHFQTGIIGDVKRGRQADSIPALIGAGETVISAPQTAAHEDTLRAIQNNTANTAAGMRGGGDTINIYGASNEEILNVINAKERQNLTGLKI